MLTRQRCTVQCGIRCGQLCTTTSSIGRTRSLDMIPMLPCATRLLPWSIHTGTPICHISNVRPNVTPSRVGLLTIRMIGHSGELYYIFSTLDQAGLPHRDPNDVVFTQLIVDYWTSFIRTHDPNPSALYLTTRGYTKTLELVKQSGHWDPVISSRDTLRVLEVPPRQSGFVDLPQCAVLGLPITYYDDQKV